LDIKSLSSLNNSIAFQYGAGSADVV